VSALVAAEQQLMRLRHELRHEFDFPARLGGDERGHDELLRAAVNRLGEQNVDAVVLAQVSMARVAAELGPHSKTPLLTSLDTSLDAIRRALQETR
jgi:aspartate/glutamate racemase